MAIHPCLRRDTSKSSLQQLRKRQETRRLLTIPGGDHALPRQNLAESLNVVCADVLDGLSGNFFDCARQARRVLQGGVGRVDDQIRVGFGQVAQADLQRATRLERVLQLVLDC